MISTLREFNKALKKLHEANDACQVTEQALNTVQAKPVNDNQTKGGISQNGCRTSS